MRDYKAENKILNDMLKDSERLAELTNLQLDSALEYIDEMEDTVKTYNKVFIGILFFNLGVFLYEIL